MTSVIKSYLEEKVVKATKKLLGSGDEAALLEVELARTTKHHRKGDVWRAETNCTLGKTLIRAEYTGESPYAVVDGVADELSREIKSFKERNKTKSIRGARRVKRILKKSS